MYKYCQFSIFQSLSSCSPSVRSVLAMLSDQYPCPDCEQTFTEAGNRDRHSKIHGDKFYQCQHCPYKTPRIDNLKSHVDRKHHGDKPLQQSTEVEPQVQSLPQVESQLYLLPKQPVQPTLMQGKINSDVEFDKRLQLPNNFVYAGSTQSVSFCFYCIKYVK